MSEDANSPAAIGVRPVAVAAALVIAMVAAAAVTYLLLDVLLLLFVGIVVASALQPWHAVLCRWKVPKGLAVLLIYLLLFLGLVAIALVIGPMLVEQIGAFMAEAPRNYTDARVWFQTSHTLPFQFLGQRMPPVDRLARALTDIAPQLYQSTLHVTTSIVTLPVYFVTVLAIAFYWTLEVPRFERLILSLVAVERRPRALNLWHEIESKLGGFIRGQGLAMLFIGAASAFGYAWIGLPNILALAVLAGLLEAVPLFGPALAVVPAILVALPLGAHTVVAVIGLAVLLHLFEANVLIPRIMHRVVGVSALVSLLAILAFGTLYGIVGIFIAIPMAAVIQVLIDTLVVNAQSVAEPQGLADDPWADLGARVRTLREQARVRMRARTSRMGIDPAMEDHVVDAVDQQIETAVARIERLISLEQETSEPLGLDVQAAIVESLQLAEIVQTAELQSGVESDEGAVADSLDQATQRFRVAVENVEALVVAAHVARAEPSA